MAPGTTGTAELLAIEDSSGGIFVRLTAPIGDLEPGRSLEIIGTLSAPYGQLEVRTIAWFSVGSLDTAPDPREVSPVEIGEETEGRLVSTRGTVDSVSTDSGRLTLAVGDGDVEVRVLADQATGLTRADVARGDTVVLTGVVGQRQSASGTADGYRIWLRSRSDLVVLSAEPTSGESAPPAETTTVYHDLASAIGERGRLVDVDATVTVAAGLFQIDGPTIVVDDGTAAVAVSLPDGAVLPAVGARIQLIGRTGTWESGPTVAATEVRALGELAATNPVQVSGALDSSLEWRLVRVYGRIESLTRAGSRWRVELLVGGTTVVVLGEPAAGISSSGLTAGRLAVVTGVVRRSTSDSSQFQLLPRSARDVLLGPATTSTAGSGAGVGRSSGSGASGSSGGTATAPRIDIGSLADYEGERVTVSGLITESDGEKAVVADGTGQARLGGAAAADQIALLEPGDVVEASGLVRADGDGWLIEVDPLSLVTLAGLTGSDPEQSSDGASAIGDGPASASAGLGSATFLSGQSSGDATGAGWALALIVLAMLAAVGVGLAGAKLAGTGLGHGACPSFGRVLGHAVTSAGGTLGRLSAPMATLQSSVTLARQRLRRRSERPLGGPPDSRSGPPAP